MFYISTVDPITEQLKTDSLRHVIAVSDGKYN